MTNDKKQKKVNRFTDKLKDKIRKFVADKKYEKAITAISLCSNIFYQYNQKYTDDSLENSVSKIAEAVREEFADSLNMVKASENAVLFYDGFGLALRGVAVTYLSALIKNGYKVIYISSVYSEEMITCLNSLDDEGEVIREYALDKDGYFAQTRRLLEIFIKYAPKAMFFYTTPYDAAGAIAFCAYENKADRFLIDLTDHAFWLGKSANDFFLGSREMSAYIQHYQRGIAKNKLIKLGVNLSVDTIAEHDGLPFDVKNKRYVFSGGALYKTLGDPNNYYYKIVAHILEQHKDVLFLYAGDGDDVELKNLEKRFTGRVFHIAERKDFYYLIEHCVFYLNTYPMFGGMMMKYAAHAKKIPVTLRHNSDSDGLLLNQENTKIEYSSYEELIEDVDRLLEDKEYLKKREKLLENAVISEERFVNNLKGAIENHKTDYEHEFAEMDTDKFRLEFLTRFNYSTALETAVNKRDIVLWTCFPSLIFAAARKKIKKKFNKNL